MKSVAILLGASPVTLPRPAHAGEIFGGVYVHDVDTPLTRSGVEGGVDLQLGWRGGRIGHDPLQPYAFAAINTAGKTNYGAVGISAKFGDKRLYPSRARPRRSTPASAGDFQRPDKIASARRILFAPSSASGARINDRVSIEASWVHMSHAQLLSRQNPGIDNVGVRAELRALSRASALTSGRIIVEVTADDRPPAFFATGRRVGLSPRAAKSPWSFSAAWWTAICWR